MGEIADMMIDGDLCEGCGVYMGSPGQGFPRRCYHCRREERENSPPKFAAPRNTAKVACKTCGRHVKAVGLDQHMRDKHAGPKPLAQKLNELEREEDPRE